MLHVILAFVRLVTPGEAAKDTLLAGGAPALMLFARLDTAVLFGVLNILVVVLFRGVELWLKYGRKGKATDDSHSP